MTDTPCFYWQDKDGSINVLIKLKPGSKKNSIDSIVPLIAGSNHNRNVTHALNITLKAQPIENKANISLIEFLSELLGIRKNSLELCTGQKSKYKTIKSKELNMDYINKLVSLINKP